jgi:DNA-binding response OmpR family regulator
MNYSAPLLICHENEDFRSMLRDMLIKHGFFQLIEATSLQEAQHAIKSMEDDYLVILQDKFTSERVESNIFEKKRFIVLTASDNEQMNLLAIRFGVKHILSFPFSSRTLFGKIIEINQ